MQDRRCEETNTFLLTLLKSTHALKTAELQKKKYSRPLMWGNKRMYGITMFKKPLKYSMLLAPDSEFRAFFLTSAFNVDFPTYPGMPTDQARSLMDEWEDFECVIWLRVQDVPTATFTVLSPPLMTSTSMQSCSKWVYTQIYRILNDGLRNLTILCTVWIERY